MGLRTKLNDYVGKIPIVGEALTTEINGKMLGAAALGLTLALTPMPSNAETPAKAPTAHGRVEVMAGHENTTIDTKLKVPIAGDLSFFTRQRPTVDYEKNVGYFGLFELDYSPVKGLTLIVDTWLGREPSAHAGLMYTGKFGDFSLVGIAKTSIQAKDPLFFAKLVLSYDLPITPELDLSMEAENTALVPYGETCVTNSHQFRLGLGFDRFEAGAALDLKQVTLPGKKDTLDLNAGGYAEVKF